ncbi:hypothetical protein D9619_005804 [Psilocybe cf. subviscida]|uniref:Voltage-gated hydrogen channel 1 n=1 Tax=Psilocybe cf. subviscida TaxID=2480587 RepID=A0A8H5BYR3_9AGAR|nr:hypothetical protein D9619_005804 [Psilocybe cf. subviscida]
MSESEQQPLLPSHRASQVEAGDPEPDSSVGKLRATQRKWQAKTAHLLERPILHKFILFLIVVDALCVFTHLAYNFLLPQCPPPSEETPEWIEALEYLSLVITTLFLVEIPLEIWALGINFLNPFKTGPEAVPHASLHLFDAVIIVTTFTLEVVLRGREREVAELLIVLRVWRLIKLVGGVAVGATEMSQEDAERVAELYRELEEVKAQLAQARSENAQLRERFGNAAWISASSTD